MKLNITDNAYKANANGWPLNDCLDTGQLNDETRSSVIRDLNIIGGKTIRDIKNENPDILVFPHSLEESRDEIGNLHICSYSESYDRLYTGNLMGFVGVNDTQLNIISRFAKTKEDYFLHYMLIKVFCPNVLKLEHDTSKDSAFDFLMYMFPHCLNEAMLQGVYKEYRLFVHNDSKVRGVIDVSQHIRRNIPFIGNISYNTREYSYDNRITQLIRHTIEHIKTSPMGKVLLNNRVMSSNIQTIRNHTPTYSANNRRKVINDNQREVRHPYFTKYTDLQKLCVSILRHQEMKYDANKDKVYGILFDGAWLWEEFLNTILMPLGFVHAENKTGKNLKFLLNDDKYERFPDFYIDNQFVIDAKYKHLDRKGIARDDIHQIISYLHVLNAKKALLAYPSETEHTDINTIGRLNGMGGEIGLIRLRIPQESNSLKNFADLIEHETEIMCDKWNSNNAIS